MSRVFVALALAGCSYNTASSFEGTAQAEGTDAIAAMAETDDASDGLTHCSGSDPGAIPGYADYRLSEVTLPSGDVDAVNWVYRGAVTLPVNVDMDSFSHAGFSANDVLAEVGLAMHFWNGAAANINLVLGDTDVECCPAEGGEDCETCDGGDGELYLRMQPSGDENGIPAYTRTTYGDDPDTDAAETSCLAGAEVRFFPAGVAADGTPVTYRWVDRGSDVRDFNSTDGSIEKPFHDTLVHELGHTLGLGDQDEGGAACSVMAHCGDPGCECNYDEIPVADAAALRHVYAEE